MLGSTGVGEDALGEILRRGTPRQCVLSIPLVSHELVMDEEQPTLDGVRLSVRNLLKQGVSDPGGDLRPTGP